VETAFSFRTRILDYIWAGLPVVATEGDTFATLIDQEGLGITVPAGDVDALEEALFRLLDDGAMAAECRRNLARVAPGFTWGRVLEPLLEFCRSPRRAADLAEPAASLTPTPLRARSLREDLVLARRYLREAGAREFSRRAYGRARGIAVRMIRER